jgi:hypothetical protein
MSNIYVKKYSASLIIRKMHIKTTIRCHLTSITMPYYQKEKKITSEAKDIEKREPLQAIGGV